MVHIFSDVADYLGTTVSVIEPILHDLNKQQKINLRRADLVGAMNKSKIDKSTITHPMLKSAQYQFIVVP